MPRYFLDPELGPLIHRTVKAFPKEFDFIDPKDIVPILVTDNPETNGTIAEVRIVPQWVRAFVKYKVALLVYGELFYSLPIETQELVIVHELEHIQPHDKYAGEYVTKRHEVNDWMMMTMALGPQWTVTSNGLGSVLASDKTSWREAIADLAIGRSNPSKFWIRRVNGRKYLHVKRS